MLNYLKMESSDETLLNELAKTAKISHKKYTIDFKIKVLKLIHLNYSLNLLSNKLNIDTETLIEQKEKESSLLLVKNKDIKYRFNKTKGFIKVFTDEEEDQIYNWIITKRENKLPISTKSLCCYAGTLKKEFADKMINTQLHWAYRFLLIWFFYQKNKS